MVRSDRYINFNWGYSSPIPQFCQGDFSVRWTKSQHFPAGGYQGIATADDGIRVWVDGELLIDAWVEQPATTYTADFELEAGSHDLVVEYFESVPRPASAFFTIARLW